MAEAQEEGFFQNKSVMMGTALILILLSFVFLAWGLNDGAFLYWLGLILLFVGMLIPPVSRWTAGTSGEEAEEGEQESEQPE